MVDSIVKVVSRSSRSMAPDEESEFKVSMVELAIRKMEEAEEPLKKDIEAEQARGPRGGTWAVPEVPDALTALESAAQMATQSLSGAKTFVGAPRPTSASTSVAAGEEAGGPAVGRELQKRGGRGAGGDREAPR